MKRGQRISRLHRIHITKKYYWFSAMCRNDTLIAMFDENENEVRVHRLVDDLLEELANIKLQGSAHLLWLAERLIATEWYKETETNSVTELQLNGAQLEQCRQLIAPSGNIKVSRWCPVDDGLAIFEWNSRAILHFKFDS